MNPDVFGKLENDCAQTSRTFSGQLYSTYFMDSPAQPSLLSRKFYQWHSYTDDPSAVRLLGQSI